MDGRMDGWIGWINKSMGWMEIIGDLILFVKTLVNKVDQGNLPPVFTVGLSAFFFHFN